MGEGSLGQARGGKRNEREAVLRESNAPYKEQGPSERIENKRMCVVQAPRWRPGRVPLHIGMGRIKARR